MSPGTDSGDTPDAPDTPDDAAPGGSEPDPSAVIEAIRRARTSRDFQSPALRRTVEEYARQCRAAGVRPERMLVLLKEHARRTVLGDMGTWYRSVVTDRMVVWAIEAYFAAA